MKMERVQKALLIHVARLMTEATGEVLHPLAGADDLRRAQRLLDEAKGLLDKAIERIEKEEAA